MSFTLHPRLSADTLPLGDLALCRALLMNNARFPWIILAPRRADISELFDLDEPDRLQLMAEIAQVAERLKTFTSAHKINVAMLGNQVPQLHVHIIARFREDAAWPNPVWNCSLSPEPYADPRETGARYASALQITTL